MSNAHAPGPLTFHESSIYANQFQLRTDGNWLCSVQLNGEQMAEKQRENVRRLVACWNACEGLTTPEIEEGDTSSNVRLMHQIRDLRAARNESLGSLVELRGELAQFLEDQFAGEFDEDHKETPFCNVRAMVKTHPAIVRADALIAELSGVTV